MLTYLRRLVEERTSLSEQITRTADTAAAEDRDMTDTEQTALAGMQTRCAEIDSQLEQYNGQAESMRAFADLTTRLEATRETRTPPAAPIEHTTWGQAFIASDEFRNYSGHGQSQPFVLENYLELRAAITTAQLAVPHFQYAPVEYQTRAPLLEVCGHVMVSAGVVDWIEIGGDPTAAVVAEGAAKPEATVTATPKSATLDTLAHWVQITRQALEDATYIRSLLEGKLRRGLLNKAEADMAAAIDASVAVQTASATAAQGGMTAAIRVGLGKVQSAGFVPNAVAANPADLATIDIAAVANPRGDPYWGLTPVAAAAIPAGKAYVGDFASGATLFDRGVTNVFLTDSHASLFISNILVILAEARLKSAVTDPLALCECTTVP